jgi:hypothetical protein
VIDLLWKDAPSARHHGPRTLFPKDERMASGTTSTKATTAPADGTADEFPNDRRKRNIPVATDRRRANNAAEKRRTSERRRLIDPTTCERDYSEEETAFMKAMDRYKRDNRRPFPTWSEVLEVLRSLGYRKVADETELPGNKKEAPAAETV